MGKACVKFTGEEAERKRRMAVFEGIVETYPEFWSHDLRKAKRGQKKASTNGIDTAALDASFE